MSNFALPQGQVPQNPLQNFNQMQLAEIPLYKRIEWQRKGFNPDSTYKAVTEGIFNSYAK